MSITTTRKHHTKNFPPIATVIAWVSCASEERYFSERTKQGILKVVFARNVFNPWRSNACHKLDEFL
jgi:hypothetical protein